ncbi:MAG TPA: SDR family oxidoreductase [Planctomycetaceae bacterium]|nr:SDR family oxidoreductase [Planctomycetaceae bacterium]
MTDPLFSVEDQVVLVSGGSRGIGRGLAAGFAERNARVILLGREEDTLKETAAAISKGRHPVEFVVCDVARQPEITRSLETVLLRTGRIDTLLNVAGVNRRKRLETVTVDDYDFIMDINLHGAFWMAHGVGKQMLSQGQGGAIVNIDSLNTFSPLKGVAPYAMSKAGLQMMTRSMALEWSDRGVRVNGLAPGFILTDLTQKLWSDPTMNAWGVANTPMRRLGVPADLVGTALFLASPASAFMTGQVLYVDGGFTAGIAWPIPLE